MEANPNVHRIIHLRTEHLGPEELLVAAKLVFSPDLSVAQLADAIDSVEVDVREEVPEARYMFLEPDVFRANAPD
jgi:divalent metal cation (Fe/Co/Zn/Cd) transporter